MCMSLCVDFLLQESSHLHWLSALRCHVRAVALDHGCLVHDVRSPSDGHTICLPLLDNCIGSWMLRDWPAAFSVMCFAVYDCGAFSIFALFTMSLSYCSLSLDCEVHVLLHHHHHHHHLLSLDFRRCADDGKFVLQLGPQLMSVLPSLLVSIGSFLFVTLPR